MERFESLESSAKNATAVLLISIRFNNGPALLTTKMKWWQRALYCTLAAFVGIDEIARFAHALSNGR